VKTTKKKYSILKFNASNNVDFSKCGGVSSLKFDFYRFSLVVYNSYALSTVGPSCPGTPNPAWLQLLNTIVYGSIV
jgi:hypothetical protein